MTTGLKPLISLQLVLPADERLQLAPALELEAVDGVLGDDHEQREVDGVDALAQDHPLPAALADGRARSPAPPGRPGGRRGRPGSCCRRRRGRASGWATAARRRGRRRSRSCPAGTVTRLTLWMRYCQPQRPKCRPPRSRSAWNPASPPSAMIRPSGTEPLRRPELLDDPHPVVGDVAHPREDHDRHTPAIRIPARRETNQSPGNSSAQTTGPNPNPIAANMLRPQKARRHRREGDARMSLPSPPRRRNCDAPGPGPPGCIRRVGSEIAGGPTAILGAGPPGATVSASHATALGDEARHVAWRGVRWRIGRLNKGLRRGAKARDRLETRARGGPRPRAAAASPGEWARDAFRSRRGYRRLSPPREAARVTFLPLLDTGVA